MAYSYTAFTGNGSTTQYAVSFPYIRREHVAVTVAGVSSTFTWVNNSLIQMDAAPAAAAAVRVYRTTPISAPLVDFADGATLVAADLDTNSRQSIYIQQELDDAQVDNLPNLIPNGNKGDITTSVGGTVWAINTGAVAEAKIATGAVTETKIGTGAVTSAKILDGTILNADVNASAGITAGKLSFTQAGTGATARTIDSKLKDAVSVKDFGAVGDGTTDDTAAIQAAITAVDSGTVFFPKGNYKTTAKLSTAYGKNIKLQGSLVYGQTSITAYHSDHVFQYDFTVAIDGIGFFRNASNVAAAKAALKSGIHSDDTGGVIDGAAYTSITNCASNDHYVGIRMHGTHQFAENNTCNDNRIGMQLTGSVHTISHNATEGNDLTGLLIQGNGHRVLTHYADGNCASVGAGQYGAITLDGSDMCNVGGVQLNDNNGAAHFYLNIARRCVFENCNFYTTTPRVTIRSAGGNNSWGNRFDIRYPGVTTISGNSYHNFFPEGWTISGGMGSVYNPIGTELPQFKIQQAFGNGDIPATSGKLLEANTGAIFDHARISMHMPLNVGTDVNLEIIGARVWVYGDGSNQTLDVKLRLLANTTGVGRVNYDLATIASGNYPYGASADSSYSQFSPLKLPASTNNFCFEILNNSAISLKGASAIVYYRFKTNQLYV